MLYLHCKNKFNFILERQWLWELTFECIRHPRRSCPVDVTTTIHVHWNPHMVTLRRWKFLTATFQCIYNERHWSAKPSAQQCMWLYCVLKSQCIKEFLRCLFCAFYLAFSSVQFAQRFQTLSCLPCAFCFVPACAKFAHEFLMLFHRPCATYFSLVWGGGEKHSRNLWCPLDKGTEWIVDQIGGPKVFCGLRLNRGLADSYQKYLKLECSVLCRNTATCESANPWVRRIH